VYQIREEDQLSRIPALKTWFRTSRAVVMHLSNGTLQINFFKVGTYRKEEARGFIFCY
jgi:hypothetical protein